MEMTDNRQTTSPHTPMKFTVAPLADRELTRSLPQMYTTITVAANVISCLIAAKQNPPLRVAPDSKLLPALICKTWQVMWGVFSKPLSLLWYLSCRSLWRGPRGCRPNRHEHLVRRRPVWEAKQMEIVLQVAPQELRKPASHQVRPLVHFQHCHLWQEAALYWLSPSPKSSGPTSIRSLGFR